MGGVRRKDSLLDGNGQKVHTFALEMSNLGFSRMGELLSSMLDSGAWKRFKTGLGKVEFLEGEFDYFLSQQGVEREHVMRGVRDVKIKARLESAMDERRTGESSYRRSIEDARREVPTQPGRPIMPFGMTQSEAKALGKELGGASPKHREALGKEVRRFSLNGGKVVKRSAVTGSPVEQLRKRAAKLSDKELDALYQALQAERKRRKGRHLKAV